MTLPIYIPNNSNKDPIPMETVADVGRKIGIGTAITTAVLASVITSIACPIIVAGGLALAICLAPTACVLASKAYNFLSQKLTRVNSDTEPTEIEMQSTDPSFDSLKEFVSQSSRQEISATPATSTSLADRLDEFFTPAPIQGEVERTRNYFWENYNRAISSIRTGQAELTEQAELFAREEAALNQRIRDLEQRVQAQATCICEARKENADLQKTLRAATAEACSTKAALISKAESLVSLPAKKMAEVATQVEHTTATASTQVDHTALNLSAATALYQEYLEGAEKFERKQRLAADKLRRDSSAEISHINKQAEEKETRAAARIESEQKTQAHRASSAAIWRQLPARQSVAIWQQAAAQREFDRKAPEREAFVTGALAAKENLAKESLNEFHEIAKIGDQIKLMQAEQRAREQLFSQIVQEAASAKLPEKFEAGAEAIKAARAEKIRLQRKAKRNRNLENQRLRKKASSTEKGGIFDTVMRTLHLH